jgi:molybdate transport system regulatory protein
MVIDPPALKLKVQLLCGEEIAMGPGKADLLDAIAREGSISGAGRAMGMSYRRAWLLVDAMNRCWAEPLVRAGPGRAGRDGNGGARLTPLGEQVLERYRALQEAVAGGAAGDWAALQPLLLPAPKPPRHGSE